MLPSGVRSGDLGTKAFGESVSTKWTYPEMQYDSNMNLYIHKYEQ